MGLVSLLFSFKGRINRQQYWFGSMGVGFAGAMLIFAVLMMAAPLPGSKDAASPAAFLVLIPVGVAMGWAGLAIQWKRFHDRNQPGWISLLPLVFAWSMMQTLIGGIMTQQPIMEVAAAMQSHMVFMWVINLAFFINLGCLGGTDGPNKYGDPPRWWGGSAAGPTPAPQTPKINVTPELLSSTSLGGAASAIERAIAEAPRGRQPVAAASAPAAMTRAASPSAAAFGRAPATGFGKKR